MSENIEIKIFDNHVGVANFVAKVVKDLVKKKQELGEQAILLLPTGSTPVPVYKELIRMHKNEGLSFKNCVTFNLDEYYPIKPEDSQSYHYYMQETFFKHVDIDKDNIHIPKGYLDVGKYQHFCEDYEEKIKKYGGFDLCLLGIGKTGHIAFNEPGSKRNDYTRLVVLHHQTRKDNSRFFKSLAAVPKHAVTCGIGTIVNRSKKVILIATGFGKSRIIHKTLEDLNVVKSNCPAAFLRDHQACTFVLDTPAAIHLKQVKSPWEIVRGASAITFQWTPEIKRQAVLWLAGRLGKSILKLNEEDFSNNHLSALYYECGGDVEKLCQGIYEGLIARIHSRHNMLLPLDEERRIVLFSPHTDDDVISMGGVLRYMALSKGNAKSHLKVAYMTSGSRGVKKFDIVRHMRFTKMTLPVLSEDQNNPVSKKIDEVLELLDNTVDYDRDPDLVSKIKTNVRKSEALNSLEAIGLTSQNAHFLDLPFYNTGVDKKAPRSKKDVTKTFDFLMQFKPTDVMVCFDLDDPHGTHTTCYFIAKEAIEAYEREAKQRVRKYLYKGAWQEFDISQIDVFVPLPKSVMEKKIDSIFQHQSQKDKPMFPGDDKREFHERARDRNMLTAKKMYQMGMPSYYAIEGLKTISPNGNLPASATAKIPTSPSRTQLDFFS